jgi:hypothetical protein
MATTRARTRHLAIVGAALVAGAFEAAHQLAWQGRIAAWPIVFEIVGIVVELELLTGVFVHGFARRDRSRRCSPCLASSRLALASPAALPRG